MLRHRALFYRQKTNSTGVNVCTEFVSVHLYICGKMCYNESDFEYREKPIYDNYEFSVCAGFRLRTGYDTGRPRWKYVPRQISKAHGEQAGRDAEKCLSRCPRSAKHGRGHACGDDSSDNDGYQCSSAAAVLQAAQQGRADHQQCRKVQPVHFRAPGFDLGNRYAADAAYIPQFFLGHTETGAKKREKLRQLAAIGFFLLLIEDTLSFHSELPFGVHPA